MMEIRQLGLLDYDLGLRVQAETATEVRSGRSAGILLSLRHPPVITLGRRSSESDVRADPDALRVEGIRVVKVDRGGGATFHYPAQAVVYPILHLGRLKLTVGGLLERIGAAVVEVLASRECRAAWDALRPGAYLLPGGTTPPLLVGAKVAAVGLHLSGDMTTHGLALNVGPGAEAFRLIVPCRTPGLAVAAMSDVLGFAPDPDEIGLELARNLAGRLRVGGT